ncbi:MAG: DUF721 domain-containing protein [Rhizobiaceae bacterium]
MSKDISQNSTEKRRKGAEARSVSEVLGTIMEPILARKTGMTIGLVNAWQELAGEEFAKVTRPEKINWPRRSNQDDPFEPATLVVACESSAALFFQHQQDTIIDRVNLFFGFEAIKRIQIIQKPVGEFVSDPGTAEINLPVEIDKKLTEDLKKIEDPELRQTLARLGRNIISSKRS